MAYPNIPDFEEDELNQMGGDDEGTPAPSTSIAGNQTPRDAVMQRISDIRNPPSPGGDYGPSPEDAMKYAQSSAQTAGFGRAINALASATGYKADNSAYDAMEKGGRDIAEKAFDRSAQVKKYMAANAIKQAQMDQTAGHQKALEDAASKGLDIKQAGVDAINNRTKVMGALSGNRTDTANIRAANTLLKDPNISKETTKLNAARSAQTLIDQIKSGELTDSKNIRNQLSTIMSTIEMGGPGAHADRAAMGVDNLYTKVKDALSFVESNPNSTIPKEYLAQLESESHALGDRAASNYHNMTKSALAGADLSMGNPDADTGKVFQLAKNRRDQFLKSAGYDPETGQSLSARDHGTKGSPGSGLINDAHAGAGKVIVSNGKETLSIDITDLPDAMKDGYQAVKRKK